MVTVATDWFDTSTTIQLKNVNRSSILVKAVTETTFYQLPNVNALAKMVRIDFKLNSGSRKFCF